MCISGSDNLLIKKVGVLMSEPMEFLINQILEKNDVKDEKLAKALVEIFDAYYKLSTQKFVTEYGFKNDLH